MINPQLSSNGVTGSGTGVAIFDKQLTGVAKKTALKDVQNQSGNLLNNHRDTSLFLGTKLAADATRVCGNKRLTPERPSSSSCHVSLTSSVENENILNVRRRFDLELGRGRMQNDIDKSVHALQMKRLCQPQKDVPQKPNQLKENNNSPAPKTMPNQLTCSQSGPSVTLSVGKPTKVTESAKVDDLAKFTSEKPNAIDIIKVANDQQRTQRFAHLQKFLKQRDECNYSDYIKSLLRLSPMELSKHAVDLEKRAIQLAIDEGKEMNRGKSLNILGKSAPTFTPSQTTQLLQPKSEQ